MRGATPINLDANASYGVLPEVLEGLGDSLGALNPSSIHGGGQRARALVEQARDRIAALLGLTRDERIIFTSGATEANTTAIWSQFLSVTDKGVGGPPRWITSAVEHHSVLEPCLRLGSSGFPGVVLPALAGYVSAAQVEESVSPTTRLVTLMYGNNETGHLTPLREVTTAVRMKSESWIHVDAVQHLGKSEEPLFSLPIDSASFSAHKIGGIPGVGALVVRSERPPEPLLVGGSQELRHRAGTENVPGIVAFGIAAETVRKNLSARIAQMIVARTAIENSIRAQIPNCSFNSPNGGGLPNTLSVTFPGLRSDDLVVALDLAGVYVSSGAACASGKPEPSHVLKGMGLSDELARATIRISVRADHTEAELARVVEAVAHAVAAGRAR